MWPLVSTPLVSWADDAVISRSRPPNPDHFIFQVSTNDKITGEITHSMLSKSLEQYTYMKLRELASKVLTKSS